MDQPKPGQIRISARTRGELEAHADKRDLHPRDMARLIVRTAVTSGLVDALLDDAERVRLVAYGRLIDRRGGVA